jgi:endogenous inhibitor of DNA gyrase (YacG/DUF329 family)
MKVQCPTCAKPSSLHATNPWRPFCSERCRLIDLGGWLDERYAIAGAPADGEREEPERVPGRTPPEA